MVVERFCQHFRSFAVALGDNQDQEVSHETAPSGWDENNGCFAGRMLVDFPQAISWPNAGPSRRQLRRAQLKFSVLLKKNFDFYLRLPPVLRQEDESFRPSFKELKSVRG